MESISASPYSAGDPGATLYDRFGRRLDYLRLSVTDRCNLRCRYCMPIDGVPCVSRAEVLSWEEMYRLCQITAECGVRKIRVTGGEPLVRSGVAPFLRRLRDLPGRPEIALTTNATLLEENLAGLADAGITRINVSLDSLRRDRFRFMTRRDLFPAAWRGIELCLDHGLELKLNVVVLAGVNDDEIADFVSLTTDRDLTVRFIEAMPFDGLGGVPGEILDGDSILERISGEFTVEPHLVTNSGVDEIYRVPGFAGLVGIIRGYTRAFCAGCSRLRVNAVGQLRTCLYAEPSLDLRDLLRGGASSEEIRLRIADAVLLRHGDGWEAESAAEHSRACSMSRIGG